MESSVYITGIISLSLVLIVWLLRDRITRLMIGGGAQRGETELTGNAEVNAIPPSDSSKNQKYSVDIGGKTILGNDKIEIDRPDVRVTRDTIAAKSNIRVSAKPDKLCDLPLSDTQNMQEAQVNSVETTDINKLQGNADLKMLPEFDRQEVEGDA